MTIILAIFVAACGGPDDASGSPSPAVSDSGSGTAASGTASLTVSDSGAVPISENLFGIFLEDINYAVDAGLYAGLIQNRSFEYGELASGGAEHGWALTGGADPQPGDALPFAVVDGSGDGTALNANNPHYAVLTNAGTTAEGIYNSGYLKGLAVTGGERYTASLFARGNTVLTLSLEDGSGKVYASGSVTVGGMEWTRYTAVLTPSESVSKDLRFCVRLAPGTADALALDMVSLMPEDTFAGLPIRKDLGEALQALNPSFLRFPGGCVIEGRDDGSIYRWKDSVGGGIPFTVNGESAVGDPAARPQVVDIWQGTAKNPYYCTYGLGFYEYFSLCEALDCIPIPVLNAGMTCQPQSGSNYKVYSVSSDEFQGFLQDALDLVEFCRGGADTTWGAVRIAMGHEEPFPLPYIAIGNEQWQNEYHRHYELFVEAFEDAARKDPALYGDVKLIVANGTASGSTEGWNYVDDYPDSVTALVDEHYYEAPSWFLSNTKRYDAYPRDRDVKVFLGEYAAQANNMTAALAEAAYMTALERNGDVVELACYAPLFGNDTRNQWEPDMIFFSRTGHYLTPNYYVQQLFGNNAGTSYLPTRVEVQMEQSQSALGGSVGLGSWMTSVSYDDLKVVSNADGAVLYENDFSDSSTLKDFDEHTGDWEIRDGRLVQTNTGEPADASTGDAAYVEGGTDWTDYTMTVTARVENGAEGFILPVCVKGSRNQIFWNLGGWGNTVSCLQIVSDGAKTGQVSGTTRSYVLQKGKDYALKIVVAGDNVKCYIGDQLMVDYTPPTAEPAYASAVRAENGDLIVKLVNVTDTALPFDMALPLSGEKTAQVTVLRAEKGGAVNTFERPDTVAPAASELTVSAAFQYEAPACSLTVIRVPAN